MLLASMKRPYPYKYGALLGLLFYPLQQLLFWFRFGRLNTQVGPGDVMFIVVGMLAMLMLFYSVNRTKKKSARCLTITLFVILGLPTALIGSLGGGLFGPIGVFLYGLIPVLVVLLLAKGIGLLVWK